jgi:hypothetical protein
LPDKQTAALVSDEPVYGPKGLEIIAQALAWVTARKSSPVRAGDKFPEIAGIESNVVY